MRPILERPAPAQDNVHTRRIAEFVSHAHATSASPREVRERIKLLILDSLGCAIYGAKLEWCRILQRDARKRWTRPAPPRSGARALRCPRRTPRWSTARRCRASSSTTCTATACCMCGAVTLPALIAVAESHAGLSGRGLPRRRGRRLRDRPARRPVHGPGAYRPGLALRRDRSASTRPPPAPRAGCGCRADADRACARHRRHPVGRA